MKTHLIALDSKLSCMNFGTHVSTLGDNEFFKITLGKKEFNILNLLWNFIKLDGSLIIN